MGRTWLVLAVAVVIAGCQDAPLDPEAQAAACRQLAQRWSDAVQPLKTGCRGPRDCVLVGNQEDDGCNGRSGIGGGGAMVVTSRYPGSEAERLEREFDASCDAWELGLIESDVGLVESGCNDGACYAIDRSCNAAPASE